MKIVDNQLTISHGTIEWNDVIDHLVETRLKPIGGAGALKTHVENGNLNLFGVTGNDVFIGCFFCRVEILMDGESELVIVHGIAAQDISIPFTSILNPIFDKIATDAGIKSIRIHSDQKGIDKIAESNGYVEIERVFRKTL